MERTEIAKEEQRRKMLLNKRQKEREELNHRLEVARNNFTIAQETLQKVLENRDLNQNKCLKIFTFKGKNFLI